MRPLKWVFATSLVLCVAFPPLVNADDGKDAAAESGQILSGKDREYRNTMLALGDRQLKNGSLNESLATFSALAERFPDDAYIHTHLGTVYLKKEEWKQAEASFKRAKDLDKQMAAAYVGLGLVYAESPAKGISAYYNFRRAVGEAKRATKIDPEDGPAYRLLGEAYERFQEEHDKAVDYYEKYIELEPDNPDGLFFFGVAAVQAKRFDLINKHLVPYLEENPLEIKLLPLVAQGHFFSERFELALEHFERYLQQIDGAERKLFTDIRFVASATELTEYLKTTGVEREAYLEQFWARRDPDILTNINERIIEHYRRVWYARTFFAQEAYPWDKRGEIYVRYGEPDFRSRSNKREFIVSPEVEAVRTRMAVDIYGPQAAFLTFSGPVFPIRTRRVYDPQDRVSPDDLAAQNSSPQTDTDAGSVDTDANNADGMVLGDRGARFDRDPFEYNDENSFNEFVNHEIRLQFGGYAPVTIDNEHETVPWETWTYTQIDGGIEITFTDEMGNGIYAYAPLPEATFEDAEAIRYISRMAEHAPEVVVQRVTSQSPDYYRPGTFGPALNFYFDLAAFRANDGQTRVEVYYGIPPDQVDSEEQGTSSLMHVKCAVALADEGHTTIYRNAEEFVYQGTRAQFADMRGAFIPEVLTTTVPPGRYELQVQIKDMLSGRTGLYKQSLEVNDYREGELNVSDIELASSIDNTQAAPKFQKGDVWIIPMPTRTYSENQKVYAYFEVYNLKRNEFGQTQYKAQYMIRSSDLPSIGIFGAVSSGVRSLFKSRKPQVTIETERTGNSPTEVEYVEIDLSKAKPGVNALEVTIKDLVSGEESSREVKFRYGR